MRNIYCKFLKKEAQGLNKPPFNNELGKEIFDNISEEAWNKWIAQQTILINEHKLVMIDPKSREFLIKKMKKFLALKD